RVEQMERAFVHRGSLLLRGPVRSRRERRRKHQTPDSPPHPGGPRVAALRETTAFRNREDVVPSRVARPCRSDSLDTPLDHRSHGIWQDRNSPGFHRVVAAKSQELTCTARLRLPPYGPCLKAISSPKVPKYFS